MVTEYTDFCLGLGWGEARARLSQAISLGRARTSSSLFFPERPMPGPLPCELRTERKQGRAEVERRARQPDPSDARRSAAFREVADSNGVE